MSNIEKVRLTMIKSQSLRDWILTHIENHLLSLFLFVHAKNKKSPAVGREHAGVTKKREATPTIFVEDYLD